MKSAKSNQYISKYSNAYMRSLSQHLATTIVVVALLHRQYQNSCSSPISHPTPSFPSIQLLFHHHHRISPLFTTGLTTVVVDAHTHTIPNNTCKHSFTIHPPPFNQFLVLELRSNLHSIPHHPSAPFVTQILIKIRKMSENGMKM